MVDLSRAKTNRFRWRTSGDRLTLHYLERKTPLVEVRPDKRYPNMYRVRLAGGAWSDIVNLSRAKDAAIALARRQDTPETAAGAPRAAFVAGEAA